MDRGSQRLEHCFSLLCWSPGVSSRRTRPFVSGFFFQSSGQVLLYGSFSVEVGLRLIWVSQCQIPGREVRLFKRYCSDTRLTDSVSESRWCFGGRFDSCLMPLVTYQWDVAKEGVWATDRAFQCPHPRPPTSLPSGSLSFAPQCH